MKHYKWKDFINYLNAQSLSHKKSKLISKPANIKKSTASEVDRLDEGFAMRGKLYLERSHHTRFILFTWDISKWKGNISIMIVMTNGKSPVTVCTEDAN